ncbi:murein hydrolase activator EnvC family protein [Leifsonia sp. NPDC058292]|uniref:murein hydrolase activator EnvC family protein n=1 Tax=Leifsonia sp. NPDC058292 TaxID=3346428 RepID=UPI0036D9B61F
MVDRKLGRRRRRRRRSGRRRAFAGRAVVAVLVASATVVSEGPGAYAAATLLEPAESQATIDQSVPVPDRRWNWPLRPPVVARGFEAPATPYAAGHRGIDLAAASGAAVAAPAAATVRFAGVVVDRPVLTLDHGSGVLSSYEPLASSLAVGETVSTGQPIGTVAAGGHCGTACLHIGVRVDGAYVSPLLFFDRVPRAVLLPLGRPG